MEPNKKQRGGWRGGGRPRNPKGMEHTTVSFRVLESQAAEIKAFLGSLNVLDRTVLLLSLIEKARN